MFKTKFKLSKYSGKSTTLVTINTKSGYLELYFSYTTLIAFKQNGKLTISENKWQTTTGKHLNAIDRDKSLRLKRPEFENKAEQLCISVNLS